MDLKEAKDKTKNVNDEVLELIDYKTNADMEKLIAEIKTLEKVMVNQIRTLYWVMGIALAAIGVLIAVR